jgi:DNA-damage-inducible protein D
MEPNIEYVKTALDARMKATPKGYPYWYGRDLMEILGYVRWENFKEVVEKSISACKNSGYVSVNHFRDITETIASGKGAKKKRENLVLSRYACYLIAMNGDTNKLEVSTAQTYFAVQTRKQEVEQALNDDQRRLLLRNRVKDANKQLAGAAQQAGVKRFAIFQDSGYRGLYNGSGLQDIKKIKGIPATEDFLDCIDREELAANEFRITQTNAKLRRDNVQGEQSASNIHFDIGRKVRQTIAEIGGTMPEKLPSVPSIKKLADKQQKETKELVGE